MSAARREAPIDPPDEFQAIVIGTGFGGAVTACRLAEAGVEVCILERGRRYEAGDLPVYPDVSTGRPVRAEGRDRIQPDFTRMFWAVGQGLWDFRDLGDVVSGQAAGYGGGSLIYANVHLRPPAEVFDDWPAPYQANQLAPYFDLAAYMLGVDVATPLRFEKTQRLEEAAKVLGIRSFRPPLAVNFGDATPAQNKAGGRCDDRADCCLGCPNQAKNTLDLNYLAKAEEAGAHVRTLAEVVTLEPTSDGRWCVGYRDHLAKGRLDLSQSDPSVEAEEDRRPPAPRLGKVVAKYVFLCAGAVNTTELLLRNTAEQRLKAVDTASLGRGYFSNVDTLATVYDCDALHEPDRGPTITSCIVHDGVHRTPDDRNPTSFVLVQDGGMASALEPLLGSFRSPLWLGRNRFLENPREAAAPGVADAGYAPLPFDSLADILSGLPRGASGQLPAFTHSVSTTAASLSHHDDWARHDEQQRRPWSLLPHQVREQLRILGWSALEDLSAIAGPIADDFLAEASEKAEASFPKDAILRRVGAGTQVRGLEDQELVRRLLRLALQLVWGSEAGLMRDLAAGLLDQLIPTPSTFATRAAGLLQWILDYRLGDPHTGMLLSMGRDTRPGRLELRQPVGLEPGKSVSQHRSAARGILLHATERFLEVAVFGSDSFVKGNDLLVDNVAIGSVTQIVPIPVPDETPLDSRVLKIEYSVEDDTHRPELQSDGGADESLPLSDTQLAAVLPPAIDTPERAAQETLLRSIAGTWNAELRTNPLWTFLGRRLTVHSMGGCTMGTASGSGPAPVTRPDGEVLNCENLYVMDASAFPTSVGVNPSATIAAVAEWKVERFLQTKLHKPGRAPEMDAAVRWADPIRQQLDPLRAPSPSSPSTLVQRPIGIQFHETMRGWYGWKVPKAERCRRDETESYPKDIDLHLVARIDDLTRFLDEHRLGMSPKVSVVAGTATVVKGKGAGKGVATKHDDVRGELALFSGARGRRRLDYHLTFGGFTLNGMKDIRNHEGLDVWEDSTTLRFELEDPQAEVGEEKTKGVVRLSGTDFFSEQIPSFEVFGTNDPVRIMWAQAAFAAFFFGHLVDVYAPGLGYVGDLLRRVGMQSHV